MFTVGSVANAFPNAFRSSAAPVANDLHTSSHAEVAVSFTAPEISPAAQVTGSSRQLVAGTADLLRNQFLPAERGGLRAERLGGQAQVTVAADVRDLPVADGPVHLDREDPEPG